FKKCPFLLNAAHILRELQPDRPLPHLASFVIHELIYPFIAHCTAEVAANKQVAIRIVECDWSSACLLDLLVVCHELLPSSRRACNSRFLVYLFVVEEQYSKRLLRQGVEAFLKTGFDGKPFCPFHQAWQNGLLHGFSFHAYCRLA